MLAHVSPLLTLVDEGAESRGEGVEGKRRQYCHMISLPVLNGYLPEPATRQGQ